MENCIEGREMRTIIRETLSLQMGVTFAVFEGSVLAPVMLVFSFPYKEFGRKTG